MSDAWIQEKRKDIIEILGKESDEKYEEVLALYAGYMLKILAGLEQIQYSQIYCYEKTVLWNAVKIFSTHFIAQVEKIQETNKFPEKKELLDDVENSLAHLADVFKNVVDGTSDSEQKMYASSTIETSIYDLSPKLIVYYSKVLNELTSIFGVAEDYAFLLHPTLKRSIKTENLFSKRDKTGKVALIYIPEKMLENINEVPIYLLHEAFHVLTKREKERWLRTQSLQENMIAAVEQVLFRDLQLENAQLQEYIIERLMESWFGNQTTWKELYEEQGDERYFYGESIEKELGKKWNECLREILNNFESTVAQVFGELVETQDIAFGKACEQFKITSQCIYGNLIDMLQGNWIVFWIKRFLSIYREAYADLACVITLDIEPELYEKVFLDSVPFAGAEETFRDTERDMRILVVSSVIAEMKQAEKRDDEENAWSKLAKNKKEKLKKEGENTDLKDGSQVAEGYKRINFTNDDLEAYLGYLRKCSKSLQEVLEKNEHIEQFREKVKKCNLNEILLGRGF